MAEEEQEDKKKDKDKELMDDVKKTVWEQIKQGMQKHPIIGTIFTFTFALVVVTYIVGMIKIEQGMVSKVVASLGIFLLIGVFYFAIKGLERNKQTIGTILSWVVMGLLLLYSLMLLVCFMCWAMNAKSCWIARVPSPLGTFRCCSDAGEVPVSGGGTAGAPLLRELRYALEGTITKRDKQGRLLKIEKIGVRFAGGALRSFAAFPFIYEDAVYVSGKDTTLNLRVSIFEEDAEGFFVEEARDTILQLALTADKPNNRFNFYREFTPAPAQRKVRKQSNPYTLRGKVLDQATGQPVSGMRVVVRNLKAKAVTTDAGGNFQFNDVLTSPGQNISLRLLGNERYAAHEDLFFVANAGETVEKTLYLPPIGTVGSQTRLSARLSTDVRDLQGNVYLPGFVNLRINGAERIAEVDPQTGIFQFDLPKTGKAVEVVFYKTLFGEQRRSINPAQSADAGLIELKLKNVAAVDYFAVYNSLDGRASSRNAPLASGACLPFALDCRDDGTGRCLSLRFEGKTLYLWERDYAGTDPNNASGLACASAADIQKQALFGRWEAGQQRTFAYNNQLFRVSSQAEGTALKAKVEKLRIE